jgi:asparagine synthetase B (glutamine-hydrolysing)
VSAVTNAAGLDSATLTALASEVTDRLRTVTLGFEEFRGTHQDEVPVAEMRTYFTSGPPSKENTSSYQFC